MKDFVVVTERSFMAGCAALQTLAALNCETVLKGGGEDASIGLWVMAYDIKYKDDRRLGVKYESGDCPDIFVGGLSPYVHAPTYQLRTK